MWLKYLIFFIIELYSLNCSSNDQICPNDMVQINKNLCLDRYEFPNKKGEKPLTIASAIKEEDDVLYFSAENLCRSVGKRMCTREEWMQGCLGSNNSIYPYGNKPDSEACNTNKHWRIWNINKIISRNDKKLLSRLDQSEPSGTREKCISAVGAYDMVGNAEEWVKCKEGKYGYCLVGGYWVNEKTPSCKFKITEHAPNWHSYESGFRCCFDIKLK